MDKRTKTWIILFVLINVVILVIFIAVAFPRFPQDKSFSTLHQVSGYLKETNDLVITRKLEIEEFTFIAVSSEDKSYFSSETLYFKNDKYYLFQATGSNTIFMKSEHGFGFIRISKINNQFVVLVHTQEFDFSGNPLVVKDSDGSNYSFLKITDKSVDFYRVYDNLPEDYVIYISDRSFNVN